MCKTALGHTVIMHTWKVQNSSWKCKKKEPCIVTSHWACLICLWTQGLGKCSMVKDFAHDTLEHCVPEIVCILSTERLAYRLHNLFGHVILCHSGYYFGWYRSVFEVRNRCGDCIEAGTTATRLLITSGRVSWRSFHTLEAIPPPAPGWDSRKWQIGEKQHDCCCYLWCDFCCCKFSLVSFFTFHKLYLFLSTRICV